MKVSKVSESRKNRKNRKIRNRRAFVAGFLLGLSLLSHSLTAFAQDKLSTTNSSNLDSPPAQSPKIPSSCPPSTPTAQHATASLIETVGSLWCIGLTSTYFLAGMACGAGIVYTVSALKKK